MTRCTKTIVDHPKAGASRIYVAGSGSAGANRSASSLVGKKLGQFRLGNVFAFGGRAVLYEIDDPDGLYKRGLLKVYDLETDQQRKWFEAESRFLTSTSSINRVVECYAYGIEGNLGYQHLERIDGFCLDQIVHPFVRKYGPGWAGFSEGVTATIIFETAKGLGAVASLDEDCCHADLKPGNVMIEFTGGIKLIDFWIGAARNEFIEGTIAGTPVTMSPEQCEGKKPDIRSDTYSLAAVMYYLYNNCYPFEGASYAEVVRRHIRGGFPSMHFPPHLRAIGMEMVRRDPDRRPQDPLVLGNRIFRAMEGQPHFPYDLNLLYNFAKNWQGSDDPVPYGSCREV